MLIFVTVLLYLTIGPAFAIPRTAAVSYEIGLSSHVDASMQTIYLAIFSLIFFVLALAFALKPGKILTWIGKIFKSTLFSIYCNFNGNCFNQSNGFT